MRIAAVTTCWNEAERLPRWLSWYGAELGREHLHVLDDGSDDGAVDGLGEVTVERRPRRAAFDDPGRARRVSDYVEALLPRYEWVLYADVDEFLVPFDGRPLAQALADPGLADTVTALGFDVIHNEAVEPGALDPERPVMAQRRHVRFNATYCKPLATRTPVRWRPGFHFSDRPLAFGSQAFGGLLLLHTRYADRGQGLRRLEASRRVALDEGAYSAHWGAPDAAFLEVLEAARTAGYAELTDADLALWRARLAERLEGSPPNAVARVRDLPDLHPSWYRLPARFAGVG